MTTTKNTVPTLEAIVEQLATAAHDKDPQTWFRLAVEAADRWKDEPIYIAHPILHYPIRIMLVSAPGFLRCGDGLDVLIDITAPGLEVIAGPAKLLKSIEAARDEMPPTDWRKEYM